MVSAKALQDVVLDPVHGAPGFRVNVQQDAAEFALYLMNTLHMEWVNKPVSPDVEMQPSKCAILICATALVIMRY